MSRPESMEIPIEEKKSGVTAANHVCARPSATGWPSRTVTLSLTFRPPYTGTTDANAADCHAGRRANARQDVFGDSHRHALSLVRCVPRLDSDGEHVLRIEL